MSGFFHLILGGSRSGKSKRGEELAASAGLPVCYVATYSPEHADAEMQARIRQHRQRRPGHWKTVENRFDLRGLILENEASVVLVDCLTLWLSYQQMQNRETESILAELEGALQTASEKQRSLILVSNEVGSGIVPLGPETRSFRDLCGSANQVAARYATKVELMVAGLPLVLKGGN